MKNTKDLELKVIVINSMNLDAYEINDEGLTFAQKAKHVLNAFENEYNYLANIKKYPNKVTRIAEWFKGMPTICSIPVYNYF